MLGLVALLLFSEFGTQRRLRSKLLPVSKRPRWQRKTKKNKFKKVYSFFLVYMLLFSYHVSTKWSFLTRDRISFSRFYLPVWPLFSHWLVLCFLPFLPPTRQCLNLHGTLVLFFLFSFLSALFLFYLIFKFYFLKVLQPCLILSTILFLYFVHVIT